ncbi:MAG: c-type cytochrome [Gammaproteobacteria bacterium]|nr:c-type cytochrome [Gammaproteobacteria bacterium]MCB1924429.1 c-type cytochrome [Gammaproteobacteria bacterium]
MKVLMSACVVTVCAMTSLQAAASAAIAQANGCLACHKEEGVLVGPSYKDIAAKYKGVGGAKAELVNKVRSGGAGNWGEVMMPPNPVISDADLAAVIDWVLAH